MLSLSVIGPIPIMLTKFRVCKVTKVFSKGFKVVKRDLLWQTWCVAPEYITQDQESLETNAFPEERELKACQWEKNV